MKEGTFYFSHDYNAIQDPKMMELLSSCGLSSIGMYWILIEILHQQSDSKISIKQYKQYIKFYCSFEHQGTALLDNIEHVLINTGLLIESDGFVYSERVIENKKTRSELSYKRSFAGKASAEARRNKALSTYGEHTPTHVEQSSTIKRNKSKVNKINKEINKESFNNNFSNSDSFPKQKNPEGQKDPPPNPPPSKPYLVLGYDQALEELLSSDSWIISTAMASKLSEAQVREKVREFISREASANPDTPPIFNELRRHCSYWIQGKFYEPKNGLKPPEKITAPVAKPPVEYRDPLPNEAKLFLLKKTGKLIRYQDELTDEHKSMLAEFYKSSRASIATSIESVANKLTREK